MGGNGCLGVADHECMGCLAQEARVGEQLGIVEVGRVLEEHGLLGRQLPQRVDEIPLGAHHPAVHLRGPEVRDVGERLVHHQAVAALGHHAQKRGRATPRRAPESQQPRLRLLSIESKRDGMMLIM